ncbi:MAG TPA: aspartate carbamoyltransferase [Candidatus Paceibacterota bacterium]|nr:aspartate carbamoyltransferase [Candidatus Paceibacterota bacterium]
MVRHIVSVTDLSAIELRKVFWRATEYKKQRYDVLTDRIVSLLFYQPSTRTIDSFDAAAKRLGAGVLKMPEMKNYSSEVKGEVLEDTILTEACYADCIVLRHDRSGAAARAAAVSPVPIINAGDGNNEHPTQAYIDLYTIWRFMERRRLPSSPRILFFGDNNQSRTVRSLTKLLVSYGAELQIHPQQLCYYGPEGAGVPPPDVQDQVLNSGITHSFDLSRPPNFRDFDLVYVTRAQDEYRVTGGEKKITNVLVFTEEMKNQLPKNAIIMHPFPRNDELPRSIDADPRAGYFIQMQNGLFVRMALLEFLLI